MLPENVTGSCASVDVQEEDFAAIKLFNKPFVYILYSKCISTIDTIMSLLLLINTCDVMSYYANHLFTSYTQS